MLALAAIGAVSGPVINSLRDLQDVRLPAAASITDGNALVWVASLSKWTNGAPVGAGFPSGGNVNDVLVNTAPGTGTWSNTLNVTTINAGTLNLTNRIGKDLISTNGGAVNDVLTFNGTIWTNAPPSGGTVTTNYDGLQITNSVHFMNTGSSNANAIYGPAGVTNGLNFANNSMNVAWGGTNVFSVSNLTTMTLGGIATATTGGGFGFFEDMQDNSPTKWYRPNINEIGLAINGTLDAYFTSASTRFTPDLLYIGGEIFLTRETTATWQLGADGNPAIDEILKANDGSAANNLTGGMLTLAPGKGTGTGAVARVLFLVATNSTSSSASVQNYAGLVAPGGTWTNNFTPVGNVGAGTDDLIAVTLPAAGLSNNKDYWEIFAWGTTAANTNPKEITVVFGTTTLIDTTAIVLNNVDWRVHGQIARTGAATEEASMEFTVGGTLLSAVNSTITKSTSPTETMANALTFKCTGTATVSPNDNDIVQRGLIVRWHPGR